MKRGKPSRFRVEEHLLPVGVVLIAIFWVVESVLDTIVFDEGNLWSTLFPASPGELWNRGLLAVVLLVFIGYVQRAVNGQQKTEELRSAAGFIVESSGDAVIGKTLEGVITSWNSGARKIYGYYAEEVIGESITILVPPERPDDIPDILEKIRRKESVDHYETERMTKDGRRLCISMNVSPILDRDGEVVGASTIARDVTRSKEAERALKESEQRFKSSFEDASIGMALVGTEGRFLQVNRSLCDILDYPEEELLAKTFQDLTHPEDLETDLGHVRQLLAGDIRTYQMEKRYFHKDGHVVWILLNVSLVRDEDSSPLYFISQMQDVTERREAEEQIKRLSRQNELILNSAGEGIFGLDLQERTEFVNPAAAEMLGYEVEELMGGSIHDIIHHSHLDGTPYPKEECPIYAALREGAVHRRTDEVFWRKDGTSFPVEYVSTPIREGGEVIGAVATFSDITERKEAEEAFRRLNETLEERVVERTALLIERGRRLKVLVGKLVAAQEEERRRVAFEVHDGLTQVAIAAHQHLQAFADDHPPGATVEAGALDRALELVRRTVMEGRRVIEDLRPTALDEFGLAAALRLQIEELENEGWVVTHEEALGEERLSLEIETALYRVAQEALNNVRKHARTKRARVALIRRPSKVYLEVRDEGRGFDPRAASGEDKGPGERVGLSGMRERVELLGGALRISSRPGRGTSVIAEVPLLASEGREHDE